MKLKTEEKENIKTYFLIKEGIEITEVTEFHNYLLLKPYGVIPFTDKIYTNKTIEKGIYLQNKNIKDISVLSGLNNLEFINISENNISDITPLSSISSLKYLGLYKNNVSDISALSVLSKLKELSLRDNKIEDISPLSTLYKLKFLFLEGNNISDVSSLSNLTNLKELFLWRNNISKGQIEYLKSRIPNCIIYSKWC